MNPAAAEWIEKAEQDFRAAKKLLAEPDPEPSAACFHCQQCVEKYLKARLAQAVVPFPRTHDLPALLTLIEPSEPLWAPWRGTLAALTAYGVDIRYPGEDATLEEAREALRQCTSIRIEVRTSLGAGNG